MCDSYAVTESSTVGYGPLIALLSELIKTWPSGPTAELQASGLHDANIKEVVNNEISRITGLAEAGLLGDTHALRKLVKDMAKHLSKIDLANESEFRTQMQSRSVALAKLQKNQRSSLSDCQQLPRRWVRHSRQDLVA